VAKKEAKKARHISSLSVAVVRKYNAKSLLRRNFAFVVLPHNSHAGSLRSAVSSCIASAMVSQAAFGRALDSWLMSHDS
jgi:hypothetical protein